MRFGVLGTLEIVDGDEVYMPSAPKVCQVLSLLLMRANRIVGTDAVIEELWDQAPVRSAVTTAQTYIYQLRKTLISYEVPGSGEPKLLTRPPGYVLRVKDDELDAQIFGRLTSQGRRLLEEGRPEEARNRLGEALALWRGPALANVARGPLLEGHVARLEELRVEALEMRVRADLELGRHRELIPELRTIVASHPLHEWFHGRLIEALHRSGRRGEALRAYEDTRRILDEQLGLEPSSELQDLQLQVLTTERPRSTGTFAGVG
ncbi:AfsR/SARP family transcriptional regulator [Actinomadura montaniterrae]|uniref:AfsR/SARP family transcriptional regulator n=1 Tax=Actinomadura montaniterrae TaxID=1803903 RepID=A0A6L3W2Z9_9ACTN|nr:AfsR/SARP family transcriptional regulator [Actinomadura montaniterrae]KAB2381577.1 AfsR/SARP family transcriptional regulator [Actinomadura montaniterrae]